MSVEKLKERVLLAEARAERAESLLDAFFTGNVPAGASLNHIILAQWGRKRLDARVKTPALLVKTTT